MSRDNVPSENLDKPIAKQEPYERLLKTFGPILTSERIFGICRFKTEDHHQTLPKRVYKFPSILLSTAIVITFIIFRKFPTAIFGTASKFNAIIEFPNIILFTYYWLTSILTNSIYSEYNIKIIKNVYYLDNTLRINESDEVYKRSCRESKIAFVILLITIILFNGVDVFEDGILTVSGVLIIIVDGFVCLEVTMLYKLLSMLNVRLEMLNNHLEDRIQKEETRLIYNIKTKNRNDKNVSTKESPLSLCELASLYDKIGVVSSLINKVYNLHILAILSAGFTYILVMIWTSLNLYSFNIKLPVTMIRIIVWCTKFVLIILILSFICEKLLSTRKHTKVLINDIIMDYEQPPRVRLEAKAFMEMIEVWSLKISVYDMFLVDISLILKFISVSTTYLIVIIQISHFVVDN